MKKEQAVLLIEEVISDIDEESNPEYPDRYHDDVIEALYQAKEAMRKVCDDCISRKEAIDVIGHWFSDLLENGNKDDPVDILNNLSSVAPVQEWNLCSERIPLEKCAVLARTASNTYSAYLEDGKWYIFGAYDTEITGVVAWTSLPKYEKEKQKDLETINYESEEEEIEH